MCHVFAILRKKVCPEETTLNVSKSGLKCHVEVESLMFRVKPILIVQLSNYFVVTCSNLIFLRNEGESACISFFFFPGYFPHHLGESCGIVVCLGKLWKYRESNNDITSYIFQWSSHMGEDFLIGSNRENI